MMLCVMVETDDCMNLKMTLNVAYITYTVAVISRFLQVDIGVVESFSSKADVDISFATLRARARPKFVINAQRMPTSWRTRYP